MRNVGQAIQVQLVQGIADDLGAERLDAGLGLAADQLLEVLVFQIAFGGVDAGTPEEGGVEESLDHLEGRVGRVAAPIAQAPEEAGQPEDLGGVLQKEVELTAGVDYPSGQRRRRFAALS